MRIFKIFTPQSKPILPYISCSNHIFPIKQSSLPIITAYACHIFIYIPLFIVHGAWSRKREMHDCDTTTEAITVVLPYNELCKSWYRDAMETFPRYEPHWWIPVTKGQR